MIFEGKGLEIITQNLAQKFSSQISKIRAQKVTNGENGEKNRVLGNLLLLFTILPSANAGNYSRKRGGQTDSASRTRSYPRECEGLLSQTFANA